MSSVVRGRLKRLESSLPPGRQLAVRVPADATDEEARRILVDKHGEPGPADRVLFIKRVIVRPSGLPAGVQCS